MPTRPGWYYDPDGRYTYEAYWDREIWTGATRSRSNKLTAAWLLWGLIGGFVATMTVFDASTRNQNSTVLLVEAVVLGPALKGLGRASGTKNRGGRFKGYLLASLLGLPAGAFGGL